MENEKKLFENKLQKIKLFPDSRNKQIVLEYIKSKQSQGLSYYRLIRILDFMYYLLANFSFDFSKTGQKEVEEVMLWINNRNWKEWTKCTYQKVFKNFLYWLQDNYNINVNVRKIKTAIPKNSLMPEYLITEEEFQRLINATDDLQTRLLIGLLYESGARIGIS